ncbi:hypothetical protein [Clostridium botulinum]|uniref:Uncharacterized protein n=3 Tax=Clostridium botulinum TaxID=1491 RepID=A0A9Q1UYH7_CLOBO|nr:hypothetical protein [Clostridium botulinum]AEB76819.1 hypothetical protein CbC4_2154 [Clostridium botulinum BKT015925]KEI02598.1 hypothetical protein Z953_06860 [Clostridium botulinum D str. 16868]KEI02697.1 hypothetical protein Y848_06870 [Clostridium botulinum C/D str. Sp77]KLU74748.1 hypothetical protein CBC3_12570 [Clostridium botulinum V891]KOA76952.1 hypothetical protein ADU78_05170 [Clostridium botulinum]
MKKIYFDFNIIKKFLFSLLYSILMGSICCKSLSYLNYKNIEILFLDIFGNLDIANIFYITPLISFIIYNIYLTFCLMDYIYRDLKEHAINVFTRTRKRSKWLFIRCLNLFLYVIIFYILHFIVIGAVGVFYNFQLSFTSISMILKIFSLVVLFNYITVLFINIISLFISPMYGYILVIITNILTMFFSAMIYLYANKCIKFIEIFPMSQLISSWHDGSVQLFQRKEYFTFYIEGFSFWYSIMYLLIISGFIIFLGNKRINKMDII